MMFGMLMDGDVMVIMTLQGILDVGMTQEDHVELVKTHTFLRKHATGKAKIELHVLQVERGNWTSTSMLDARCWTSHVSVSRHELGPGPGEGQGAGQH